VGCAELRRVATGCAGLRRVDGRHGHMGVGGGAVSRGGSVSLYRKAWRELAPRQPSARPPVHPVARTVARPVARHRAIAPLGLTAEKAS